MSIVIDDLLRSSFRCIANLAPGFGHNTSERTDALFVLNAMLDAWSAEGMNAYATLTSAYSLTAAKESYTVGSGGDWNGARPVKVLDATLVILTNPVQPLRVPLVPADENQFQRIALQLTQSTYPQRYFYNPTWPLGTFKVWPVPVDSTNQVEVSSYQQLAGNFVAGTDAVSFPPGYLDAVRYNLALRLALEWQRQGAVLNPGVAQLASDSLANIQRLNAPTPQMDCNPGVFPIGTGRGGFNRLTGD